MLQNIEKKRLCLFVNKYAKTHTTSGLINPYCSDSLAGRMCYSGISSTVKPLIRQEQYIQGFLIRSAPGKILCDNFCSYTHPSDKYS